MFIKNWSWILYSENKYFIATICVIFMILTGIGVGVFKQMIESYQNQQNQFQYLIHKLETEKKIIDAYTKEDNYFTVFMSWGLLGGIYSLATRTGDLKIYYAGTTSQALDLLIYVLKDAYDISGFYLERNKQKTVLAILL